MLFCNNMFMVLQLVQLILFQQFVRCCWNNMFMAFQSFHLIVVAESRGGEG